MAQYVVVSTAEDNGEQQTFGPYRSLSKAASVEIQIIAVCGNDGDSYDPDVSGVHTQVCRLEEWRP